MNGVNFTYGHKALNHNLGRGRGVGVWGISKHSPQGHNLSWMAWSMLRASRGVVLDTFNSIISTTTKRTAPLKFLKFSLDAEDETARVSFINNTNTGVLCTLKAEGSWRKLQSTRKLRKLWSTQVSCTSPLAQATWHLFQWSQYNSKSGCGQGFPRHGPPPPPQKKKKKKKIS